MSNKYEQLVEFIINDETDKARELFHQIVVEKSRDIYENLVSEEDLDEVGGNQVEDMVKDVQMDEEGISEYRYIPTRHYRGYNTPRSLKFGVTGRF
jgi:hypothetical protein